MQEFHWRSSGFLVVSQGFVHVQCIAEQQHVRSLQAGSGTARRERSPPGSAGDSEHTGEAQHEQEV